MGSEKKLRVEYYQPKLKGELEPPIFSGQRGQKRRGASLYGTSPLIRVEDAMMATGGGKLHASELARNTGEIHMFAPVQLGRQRSYLPILPGWKERRGNDSRPQ